MTTHKTEVMTLCNRCASIIEDDDEQTIRRADPRQRIQEPCFICGHKGWDYEVETKEVNHG
ncbi:hypothetical protein [Acetobacterium wieringae]|uniref:hypothetical protein n=1 Tax=Acetobacterium wieringae TaxID=52694 RepID=UPI0031598EB6